MVFEGLFPSRDRPLWRYRPSPRLLLVPAERPGLGPRERGQMIPEKFRHDATLLAFFTLESAQRARGTTISQKNSAMTLFSDKPSSCTQLTLYLPGILSARGNDYKAMGMYRALETLLTRAEQKPQAGGPTGPEHDLFRLFGLEQEENTDLPVAAVSRMHDMGVIDNDWWLCADPVHLSLEHDHLILADARKLDIAPDEADRLVTEIMEVFTADGWLLKAPRPDRWYLKLARAPKMTTTLLSQVIGRDVHPFLPRGPDGMAWHTTLNEIQILLHTTAVNAEREKNGKLPINSLWFWGGGHLPRIQPVSWTRIWSKEPISLSLARLSGTPSENTPDRFDDWRKQAGRPGEYLVVLDDAQHAALYADAPGWSSALQRLERDWMMPLLQALKSNAIANATLITDTGMSFSLTSRQARRWWRFRRPLTAYLMAPS